MATETAETATAETVEIITFMVTDDYITYTDDDGDLCSRKRSEIDALVSGKSSYTDTHYLTIKWKNDPTTSIMFETLKEAREAHFKLIR